MMNIPFVDLKGQYLSIKKDIDEAIQAVIEETAFIRGRYVKEFERQFAELYGVKNCISVANGTDALYIIMKMLGIGPGDEVITTAYSWISSSETITQTGARPVFVDIDPYYTIDESKIEEKITPRTRAIVVVHIHGQMSGMDAISRIAEKHNLQIIEDCAQSHFSEYKGRRAGTIGTAGAFSFYPGKNLGAYGDAGCIITNNDPLAEKFRMYADHGALIKHQHQIEGISSRLDGLQAAILSAKLPYITSWTEKRIQNAAIYDNYLKDIPQVQIPQVRPATKHSFHLYVIQAEQRDQLKEYLKNKGISTVVHYPRALPNLECYEYLSESETACPVATRNEQTMLSLPMFPELTKEQIGYVCKSIESFFAK